MGTLVRGWRSKMAVVAIAGVLALYSCHKRTRVTPLRLRSRCTGTQSGVGRRATGVLAAVANSRLSRAVSSSASGRGQDRPAAWARRTYSATVGRLTRKL